MRSQVRYRNCSSLMFALALPAAAFGQTAGPAAASNEATSRDADPASSGSVGLQDIVVTAQRRGENLQKVPIAISAVTAAMADAMGVKGTQDISIAAPAVNFGETSSGANITIRGVGASGSSVDEAANAVYIDGVYQAAAPALALPLNNIERVEVAKGPQGTLFGRNSTGGVIQIITRDPPKTPTADVSVGYGNYQTVETQAYIGSSLATGVTGDLAIFYSNQDKGWGRNIASGQDTYTGRNFSIRSKVRMELGERTNLTLVGSYIDIRPAASQGGSVFPGELTLSGGGVSGSRYAGFYNSDSNSPNQKLVVQHQFSAKLEHDFGWARFVNISSYSKTKLNFLQDVDAGRADIVAARIDYPVRATTEEIQLLSPAGSTITWTAGLFYMNYNNSLAPYTLRGLSQGSATAQTMIVADAKTRSYSAYGQATAPVFTDTNLTVGLRYTIDDRSFHDAVTDPAGAVTRIAGSTTDKKLTWRLGLDHHFSGDLLGYVSYNRGYKSGLYNIAAPTQPSVGPEVVDAYEAGFKSQLFDNHLRLNVSAFYYDVKGIQVRTSSATGGAVLLNAATSKLKGVDVDVTGNPFHNFTVQGGLAFLDATYSKFANAPFLTQRPAGGFVQVPGDASGNRIILSPRWVGTLAGSYKMPVSFGTIALSGAIYYNDGYYFDPQNRLKQDAYTLLNAGLSWISLSGALELRAWGRNLSSRRYRVFATYSSTADEYYPGAPRTYGLTARARFK